MLPAELQCSDPRGWFGRNRSTGQKLSARTGKCGINSRLGSKNRVASGAFRHMWRHRPLRSSALRGDICGPARTGGSKGLVLRAGLPLGHHGVLQSGVGGTTDPSMIHYDGTSPWLQQWQCCLQRWECRYPGALSGSERGQKRVRAANRAQAANRTQARRRVRPTPCPSHLSGGWTCQC